MAVGIIVKLNYFCLFWSFVATMATTVVHIEARVEPFYKTEWRKRKTAVIDESNNKQEQFILINDSFMHVPDVRWSAPYR